MQLPHISARIVTIVGATAFVAAIGVSLVAREQRQQGRAPAPVAPATINAPTAAPAYIVVNQATPVLFSVKIADRQLKKRSVVLLRLDSAGKPADILGRLRDDGTNGDLKAGDDIYSVRTSLTETTVGQTPFAVAARFKPGTWREPEADDDDWDREFAALGRVGRDRPALRALVAALLKRLAGKYLISDAVTVTTLMAYRDSGASYRVGHDQALRPEPVASERPAFVRGIFFSRSGEPPHISISVYTNPSRLSVTEWYDAVLKDKEYVMSDSSVSSASFVSVAGIQSLQVTSHLLDDIKVRTYVPFNDTVFGIECSFVDLDALPREYAEMLNTFTPQ